jgi:2-polyprenyl-6-methoxyphenol hydroxylase-like FAD-dependent oxidoreductase
LIFCAILILIRKERPLGEPTRVSLLGDSIHAMTPHAGLGENTAFKDAVDLGKALRAEDWHVALRDYETVLVKRGKWASGWVGEDEEVCL